MELKVLKPRLFINPLLSKKTLSVEAFNDFSEFLKAYAQEAVDQHIAKQSEPNIVTNALKPFLDKLGYVTNAHSQNGQSGMDLAILKNGRPAVIIEAKKFGSTDMISENNLNKKAFHEAVLYFMRERHKENNGIFHIIITDFFNWYIFDAKKFDKLFWQDKTINKQFKSLIDQNLLGDKTKDFYQFLEKEIPKFKEDLLNSEKIECAHFDVRKSMPDKERIALLKLLGPDTLLKEFNPNDANSLNKDFYSELLYILGLQESKIGGKKLIDRMKEPQPGSMFENALNKLKQYNKPHQFEDIIKLLILWINRILFLKLLESQIVNWTENKNYKFLTLAKVNDYDMLENMFFDILANEPTKRKNRNFDYIPYLNSSLFEPHKDEHDGLYISSLSNDTHLNYFSKTVIKDASSKRKSGKTNLLSYLFEFLDAYNFSSESVDEIVPESKSLISASVLGLIFEKINGYKDGSYYTPSFVTMYMAKESIEKSIITKFNEAKSWSCANLIDLHNKNIDISEANQIINSLRICDPAVGSGHFLVSALNEILRIKSDLGVLVDENGLRIKDYVISIENDELIVRSDDGELFDYKINSIEKTRIQKTLFKEKQKIIEGSLFGVDINPNSVNICRLRLWIELLKNAYYKSDGMLDTLPNIDINIKCGNSLISRFDTTDKIQSKNLKSQVKEYKRSVSAYKIGQYDIEEGHGGNLNTSKAAVLQAINKIKSTFTEALKKEHQVAKKLENALVQYVSIFGFEKLDKDLLIKAIEWKLSQQNTLFKVKKDTNKQKTQLIELNKLKLKIQEIEYGQVYLDAFEWRFEFPEALDDSGKFVGFDVVIGNPPYGVSIKDLARQHISESLGKVPDYEIYYWFINLANKILKPNGVLSYILPNTILFNVYAKNYRLAFLDDWNIDEILDCTNFEVFSEAKVNNVIISLTKFNNSQNICYRNTDNVTSFSNLISRERQYCDKKVLVENNNNWALIFKLSSAVIELITQIKKSCVSLNQFFPETSQGLIAYDKYQGQDEYTIKNRIYHHQNNDDGKYKKWLWGEDVRKYKVTWNGKEYLDYSNNIANPRDPKYFLGKRILVREITNPSIFAALTNEELYNDPSVLIIKDHVESKISIETLLAILNSKLATFVHFNSAPKATKGTFPKILVTDLNNFPLPANVDSKVNEEIKKTIIEYTKSNTDTETKFITFEQKINHLVYKLYGLSQAQINYIDPAHLDT